MFSGKSIPQTSFQRGPVGDRRIPSGTDSGRPPIDAELVRKTARLARLKSTNLKSRKWSSTWKRFSDLVADLGIGSGSQSDSFSETEGESTLPVSEWREDVAATEGQPGGPRDPKVLGSNAPDWRDKFFVTPELWEGIEMSESADSGVLPAPESTSLEVMAHLKTGKCTTVELIRHYLKYLETTGRDLGAAVEIFFPIQHWLQHRKDTRRASGKPLGCLEGVPFTAKMNIATREEPRMPPVACFAVLRRLRIPLLLQGCVLRVPFWQGKSNCDRCAGSFNESSHHGVVHNPGIETVFLEDRVVGAAALAGSLVGLFISEAIPVAQCVSRQPFVVLRE